MSLRDRIAKALFADTIAQQVQEAVKVIDDDWWRRIGTQARPDDLDPDSPLSAYYKSPLGFRIVNLMVNHVLGEGVIWHLPDQAAADWLKSWWHHPLNTMDLRIRQWLIELVITGDLYVTLHPDADGFCIMRAIPSTAIDKIEANAEDLEDETRFHQLTDTPDGKWWKAFHHEGGTSPSGGDTLHFSINRPVGHQTGQSDLQTVLPWLKRYTTWMKDRVAINKVKTAFVWDVALTGTDEDVRRRRAELATPPQTGSVIIHNEAEEWKAIAAKIDAGDAEPDGKALRLLIAAGVGIPLHFLSEGESATKATAREMGEPTRRAFAERQKVFGIILQTVARAAASFALGTGAMEPFDPDLITAPRFPDITREDNFFLAQAASQIVTALATAVDKGWLDDKEAATWFRKFAGETPYGITTT